MNTAAVQNKDYNLEYEDVFSGPIFLLVELVQKKKIDIYDISLSYIINGFIEFIKEKSGVLLDTISSFTYFSSILLEIKSRSLLPSKSKEKEEGGELGINILRRREEEYRIYKKVSNYISSKILDESLYYIREAPIEKDFLETLPDFTKKIELGQLWMTACMLLTKKEFELDLDDIYNHRSTINIFDEMGRIKDILKSRDDITFREISSIYKKVMDRIISFLSILELYKSEEIEIVQFENFGNIVIKIK
ncbi:MAG: segregation/condensation protein A [Actinobacteria bacterium]|nr:segregation/condensation protein A [Actinomycetota bacterium]